MEKATAKISQTHLPLANKSLLIKLATKKEKKNIPALIKVKSHHFRFLTAFANHIFYLLLNR